MFLTDWESGEDIYISREAEILVMYRLPGVAKTEDNRLTRDISARTRIELERTTFLVRETPKEILELRNSE